VQEPIGREVAVKVILPGMGGDRETLEKRFLLEAKAVARLEHPNIVTLHHFGVEPDGTLFMVLELVRGTSLAKVLEQRGKLPVSEAVAGAVAVLDALSEAHALGIVHRDLKPANIMLRPATRGELSFKVLDFGIARLLDDGSVGTGLTKTGAVFGTPHYMSPEQAEGKPVDHRTDLYAVGVILQECISGSPPFTGSNSLAVLLKQRDAPPPDLPDEPGVTPALRAMVSQALAKAPEARFESAEEMAQALLTATGLDVRPSASGHVPLMPAPADLLDEEDWDTAAVHSTTLEMAGEATAAVDRPRAGWGLAVAAAVVLGGVGVAVGIGVLRSPPPSPVPAAERQASPGGEEGVAEEPPASPGRAAAEEALRRASGALEEGDLDLAAREAEEAVRLAEGFEDLQGRGAELLAAVRETIRQLEAPSRAKPAGPPAKAKKARPKAKRPKPARKPRKKAPAKKRRRGGEVQGGIRATEL